MHQTGARHDLGHGQLHEPGASLRQGDGPSVRSVFVRIDPLRDGVRQAGIRKRESVQILSAIVTEDPPVLDSGIPAPLRWSIDRCLAKDPADRYESTRDLHRELRGLRDHLSEASSGSVLGGPTVSGSEPRPRGVRWSVPAAFALGAELRGCLIRPSPDHQSPISRLTGLRRCHLRRAARQCGMVSRRQCRSVLCRQRPRYPSSGIYPLPGFACSASATHASKSVRPLAWTPDGTRVLFLQYGPEEIRSVASVGGESEPWVPLSELHGDVAISPDAKTAAVVRSDKGVAGVWVVAGTPVTQYLPAPFASRANPQLPDLEVRAQRHANAIDDKWQSRRRRNLAPPFHQALTTETNLV